MRSSIIIAGLFAILVACGGAQLHSLDAKSETAPLEEDNVEAESTEEKLTKPQAEHVTDVFVAEDNMTSVPTDVIFAVDTSGSMSEETIKLEKTLPKFIETLSETFSDDSFQMFMLADKKDININLTNANQRYHLKDHEVKSKNALEVILDFVSNKEYQCVDDKIVADGCVRENSMKQMVVVSDDISDYSASEFIDLVNSNDFLKGKTSINGFVGTSIDNEADWCSIVKVGQTYIDLAKDASTSGLVQHLCEENYALLLQNLSAAILKGSLKRDFNLSSDADPEFPVIVELNGQALNQDQFSIKGSVVSLFEGLKAGQTLEITYMPIKD